ncbi:MAG: hypothetical protein CME63_08695 [Halobacteriovoraceae bacterium]|nr:hypothetical protein [Halobacteriovoraceae bacterium]
MRINELEHKREESLKKPWKAPGLKLTGPIDRFVVFLGNLSLGSFVSHYLLSFKPFRDLESSLVEIFTPVANLLFLPSEVVSYLPMVFIISQAIIFLSTLLWGRSLFEMIAGMKNSGPWWWQRIGAGARSIAHIFLGPFLIFDLPLLIQSPSLKERIFGSYSLVGKGGASLRLLLIVPFFLVFTLMAPLMTNLELLQGHKVTMEKMEKGKLEKGQSFSSYKEVKSDLFHVKSFTSFANGEFWPIPDYDRIRARKKKKISPSLLIYSSKNKSSGHWRIKKQISLLSLLSLGKRGNPLFSLHFPHLNSALELYKQNPSAFKKKDALSKERLDDLFSPDLKKEIQKFFKVSFELGSDNIVGHTLNYGPFMRGFLEVRQAVTGLLPKGGEIEVDLIEVGNQVFLRFRQNHDEKSILGKSVTETYLSLGSEHALLFELGWEKSLSGAIAAKTFRETILSQSEWFFDYKNLFKERLSKRLDDWGKEAALYILDLLVEKELSNREQDLLERLMYRFYFDLCREAIKSSDDNFYQLVKKNYERLSSFIEYKNTLEDKDAHFSDNFNSSWKFLWNALRLKKDEFFEENESILKESTSVDRVN